MNYSLTVGSPGTGKTDLFVYNKSVFSGQVEFTTGSGLEINTGVRASEQFTDLITPVVKSTLELLPQLPLLLTLTHLFLLGTIYRHWNHNKLCRFGH